MATSMRDLVAKLTGHRPDPTRVFVLVSNPSRLGYTFDTVGIARLFGVRQEKLRPARICPKGGAYLFPIKTEERHGLICSDIDRTRPARAMALMTDDDTLVEMRKLWPQLVLKSDKNWALGLLQRVE
jgi:hypothetical protein